MAGWSWAGVRGGPTHNLSDCNWLLTTLQQVHANKAIIFFIASKLHQLTVSDGVLHQQTVGERSWLYSIRGINIATPSSQLLVFKFIVHMKSGSNSTTKSLHHIKNVYFTICISRIFTNTSANHVYVHNRGWKSHINIVTMMIRLRKWPNKCHNCEMTHIRWLI